MDTIYVWKHRLWSPDRYGRLCRIVKAVRGKFLIEFTAGYRVLTVRGTFKRLI